MAYGLNAATGKYFCLWCHCTKAKICNFSIQDWPIERNLQQCMKNSTEKTTEGRKGSIHEPLISTPLAQVIVDTLHLFLRIMGLLFHQVIEFVINNKRMDILEKELENIGVPLSFSKYSVRMGHLKHSGLDWMVKTSEQSYTNWIINQSLRGEVIKE